MSECQKCLFDKEMCVCRGKHMNDELRRYVVQEIAHMVARGIKTGVFEDWTVANKIADKYDKAVKEAMREELSRVWYSEKEGLIFYSRSGSVTTLTDRIAELQEGKE